MLIPIWEEEWQIELIYRELPPFLYHSGTCIPGRHGNVSGSCQCPLEPYNFPLDGMESSVVSPSFAGIETWERGLGETPDTGGAGSLLSNCRHHSALDSNAEMSALWDCPFPGFGPKPHSEDTVHCEALGTFMSTQRLWVTQNMSYHVKPLCDRGSVNRSVGFGVPQTGDCRLTFPLYNLSRWLEVSFFCKMEIRMPNVVMQVTWTCTRVTLTRVPGAEDLTDCWRFGLWLVRSVVVTVNFFCW